MVYKIDSVPTPTYDPESPQSLPYQTAKAFKSHLVQHYGYTEDFHEAGAFWSHDINQLEKNVAELMDRELKFYEKSSAGYKLIFDNKFSHVYSDYALTYKFSPDAR